MKQIVAYEIRNKSLSNRNLQSQTVSEKIAPEHKEPMLHCGSVAFLQFITIISKTSASTKFFYIKVIVAHEIFYKICLKHNAASLTIFRKMTLEHIKPLYYGSKIFTFAQPHFDLSPLT